MRFAAGLCLVLTCSTVFAGQQAQRPLKFGDRVGARGPLPVPAPRENSVDSMIPPGFRCTDLGPAPPNKVVQVCGGLVDSDTERLDIVLGGPLLGGTTLRGVEFGLLYPPSAIELVPEASYSSPLFSPNAVVTVTPNPVLPGLLDVSIHELDTIPEPVSVGAGQNIILSLKFRRRAWGDFGNVHALFSGFFAISPSTPIDFSTTVEFQYQTCPPENTWTATSVDLVPSNRLLHTAVWTGSSMIVWGGWDGDNSEFATGGRYDAATDTWQLTQTSGAPSARDSHTAVWTGSEMIVWGGWDGG